MARCAVVQLSDGVVVNIIVAEPTNLAPNGCELRSVDSIKCNIGWVWNGVEFINPNPEPIDEVPPEDITNGN